MRREVLVILIVIFISGDIEVTAGEAFINGFSILSQMDLVR